MNSNQLSDSRFNTIVSSSLISSSTEQELSRGGLERSRKTILYGWIISMIGIVIYCFVMSNGDQQPDLPSTLAAIIVILIGVGLWFTGCVRFLNDAAGSSTDPVDW